MKQHKLVFSIIMIGILVSGAFAQSALFLLISPGARAGGMGEAQVALADDSYASYWNPAGLGFQEGYELSGMHVNWLPGLVDDMYYDFLGAKIPVENLGVFGGHIIYLNAGEQTYTDANGNELGTFSTYFASTALSYSTMLTPKSSVGFNFKILHQHLTDDDIVVEGERTKGTATNFGFDFGFLWKDKLWGTTDFGMLVANIGPKIIFNDEKQADPMPTNLKLGLNFAAYESKFNRVNIIYDANKLLVGEYAAMDWDGDKVIGGYDESGNEDADGIYNASGTIETAHTDSWYAGIVTSFLDDWYLGGDRDYDGDGFIGGYDAIQEGDSLITNPSDNGLYSEDGDLEVGSGAERNFTDEFSTLIHSLGVEYWYNNMFAIRAGYNHDAEGKILTPTIGAGLRYGNYGFDFGYTIAEETHPLNNTMRFSLLLKF